AAQSPRPARRGEVMPERRMREADARHRGLDPLGDDEARALGGGARPARAAAKPDRASECSADGVDLVAGPCAPSEVVAALGLGLLFPQLGEAPPVLCPRLRVHDRAEIAAGGGA